MTSPFICRRLLGLETPLGHPRARANTPGGTPLGVAGSNLSGAEFEPVTNVRHTAGRLLWRRACVRFALFGAQGRMCLNSPLCVPMACLTLGIPALRDEMRNKLVDTLFFRSPLLCPGPGRETAMCPEAVVPRVSPRHACRLTRPAAQRVERLLAS